jgi:uncharacterized protein (DUF927 family)
MTKQYKNIDLDKHIDYERFYSRYLKNMKKTGTDKISAQCPFHDDQHNSFWFRIQNGCWKCEAGCGSGNAIMFLEKIEKISGKEAYKKLLKEAGLLKDDEKKEKLMKYTLDDYSKEKKIPLEFLSQICNMKQEDKNKRYISIYYRDEQSNIVSVRKRFHPKSKKRFAWVTGAKIVPYGLWRLSEFNKDYIILVEGESDTQTLWYHGYQALGIAGASNLRCEDFKHLEKFEKVYIWQEPDRGGTTFIERFIRLAGETGFEKPCFILQSDKFKDVSEIHIHHNGNHEKFVEEINSIIENAKPIDIEKQNKNLFGVDFKYNTPQGYYITPEGILKDGKNGQQIEVTRTPIFIAKKLKDIENLQEKVELVFISNNQKHTLVVEKSQLASTKEIVGLSNFGVLVNSNNAKLLVQYLYDYEAVNSSLIPLQYMTNKLGWYKDKFIPFEDNIVVLFNGGIFEGLNTAGTFQEWQQGIQQFRFNEAFRFIMAASFTAPLLNLLNQRIFLIHLWGDSRSGKTATLKAALSIWGNPDDLVVTFNATKVGLEKIANFYNDLPIGIDERQVANNQEFIENLVYMLSLGKGKLRGSKGGGLQPLSTWHTVILSTGEEPLSSTTSNEGVFTRTIEINLKPFDNEEQARACYEVIQSNYGWAGREWIKAIQQEKELLQQIKNTSRMFFDELIKHYPQILQSHAQALALVGAVDIKISELIFKEKQPEDITMVTLEAVAEQLQGTEEVDIGQRAYDYILDMINAHIKNFEEEAKERWGFLQDGVVEFFPSVLEKLLREMNFNPKKVYAAWEEKGLIKVTFEKDAKRYSCLKWLNGKPVRVVKLKMLQETETKATM